MSQLHSHVGPISLSEVMYAEDLTSFEDLHSRATHSGGLMAQLTYLALYNLGPWLYMRSLMRDGRGVSTNLAL